jgi:hypothetical protein
MPLAGRPAQRAGWIFTAPKSKLMHQLIVDTLTGPETAANLQVRHRDHGPDPGNGTKPVVKTGCCDPSGGLSAMKGVCLMTKTFP